MEVNNLNTNRRAQIGNITIPLLKGEQGYSISRIVRTSGDGGAGTVDTYTVYIDTDPETAIGTFQVVNGTGGDMSKNVYDIDNDDIVDRATGDGNGNEITATYETIENVTALANRVATLEQAGYITRSVADLANYYLKSETYTKQEVNYLCDMIPKFAIEVVNTLPTQDISETTIYLLRDDEETQDVYQEYIYVNNTWERIGGQRIDLSNYYQKNETYSKEDLNGKLVNVGTEAPENGERVWLSKSTNLMPNKLTNTTINGLTIVVGDDKSITINGTTNATTNIDLTDVFNLESGSYIISTNKEGTLNQSAYFLVLDANAGTELLSLNLASASEKTFTLNSNTSVKIRIYISTDRTFTNFKIYPMIGTTVTTYEPYIEKSIKVDNDDFISMSNLVSVGSNKPSDGKRVWFKKSVNLYNGSQDFSGTWVNSDRWATADETYNGLVIKKSSNQWNGLYKDIQLKSGKKYVFSAYVKSDVPRNVTIYLTGSTGACNPQSEQNIQITNEWQRISLVFSTTNNGLFRARVENMTNEGAGSYTYVCGYQLQEGSTVTPYEPYVEPSINVDEEEWYNQSFNIKSIFFSSITTSSTGYYNTGLKCNEVAIIGLKHNIIDTATKLEIYSDEQGRLFIRCSVNGSYVSKTISNLTIYYI